MGFGANGLDFEAVYIVQDPDYNLYMDEQQRINLELLQQLAARGIPLALPSRVLYGVGAPAAGDTGGPRTS